MIDTHYLNHKEGDNTTWGQFCEQQKQKFINAGFRLSDEPIDDWVPLIYNGDVYYIHPDDVLSYSQFRRSQTLDRRDFKTVYNKRI